MGGTILKLSRSPAIPPNREDILITMEVITMEDIRTMEEFHTTTVALRMAMGMEEATVRTVPTPQHQPRGSEPHYLFPVREDWTL